ncbi:Acg family FMN-binding oxidoreductase [Polaribacter porphyrae]|uniref:Nitroreductase n=1 Tax=Polaribacter porphyrae TaxID=1137780 RepID=A0A2S7WNQ8_9FLAO|nr:hypothetical protein [Polaribacter porphyrae]PQJ79224.1 hypothetical protein BTO18_08590 [Polaribacter porphyrae]
MDRRKFIVGSAALVTMTTLSCYGYNNSKKITKDKIKRPSPNNFKEPIFKAIAYGVSASNPHNTQAWKFKILNDKEMLLFVDSTRILPETDPSTRQIHIGCGCFLETALIGMTKKGYSSKIDYFPSGEYNILEIGELPVAKLSLKKDIKTINSPLNKVLLNRRTSRLKFSDEVIDISTWNTISKLIGKKHNSIQLITDLEALNVIRPILSEGMKVESYTYRTNEESRKWFRENDERIASKRDGINLEGNGIKGIKKWFAERELKGLSSKAWNDKKTLDFTLKNHSKKVNSSSNIIIIISTTNTMIDWVKAGQDYTRLQLSCLLKGFFMQPLSQVLQEFEEMKSLKSRFETEMNVKENEKIQMVLRCGKSKKPFLTYRREIKDMITE